MSTILLIEDDEALREMYQQKFTNAGLKPLTADNGEDGLKIALKNHPNVILLDLLMPKMNGAQVLDKLRKDDWGAKVPVVILTNVDEYDQMLLRVMKNNPSQYLIKSETTPADVLKVVKKLL